MNSPSALPDPQIPSLRDFAQRVSCALLVVAVVVFCLQTIGPNLVNPLAIDEQVTFYIARGKSPDSVLARATAQSATPPLYFWMADWSLSLGEVVTPARHREFWLRFPAWLCLSLSLFAIYRFSELFLGRGTGGATALLLATHAELIPYATQARPYTLAVLATLSAFGSVFRLRSPDHKLRHAIVFVAANVALLWTHYLLVILLPVEWLVAKMINPRTPQEKVPLSLWKITGLLGLAVCSTFPLAMGIFRLMEDGDARDWMTTLAPWHQSLRLFASNWYGATLLILAAALAVARYGSDQTPARDVAPQPRLGLLLVLWVALPVSTLWLAGRFYANSLAEMRYIVELAAPAGLLIVMTLRAAFGGRILWLLTLLFVLANGSIQRTQDRFQHPHRNEEDWRQAAILLNEQARPGDLVFVYSGLTETRFVPVSYDDPGFQEYATSRLSDFYLKVGLQRLALPVPFIPGDWLTAYERQLQTARAADATVWLVVAADTDLGQRCETSARNWLQQHQLNFGLVREQPVARVLRTPVLQNRSDPDNLRE